jgi:hypothetical protein
VRAVRAGRAVAAAAAGLDHPHPAARAPPPPLPLLQLLGLQGVQLPLQPAVEKAYDDLINTPLEAGFR